MTTPHPATATVPAPALAFDRDRSAWVAPLIATLLLLFLGPAALFLGGMSAMATDSCGPDDCSSALMTQLDVIYAALPIGGVLTFAAWFAAWVLPWTQRWSQVRAVVALSSLLPSLLVLGLVLTLPAP